MKAGGCCAAKSEPEVKAGGCCAAKSEPEVKAGGCCAPKSEPEVKAGGCCAAKAAAGHAHAVAAVAGVSELPHGASAWKPPGGVRLRGKHVRSAGCQYMLVPAQTDASLGNLRVEVRLHT